MPSAAIINQIAMLLTESSRDLGDWQLGESICEGPLDGRVRGRKPRLGHALRTQGRNQHPRPASLASNDGHDEQPQQLPSGPLPAVDQFDDRLEQDAENIHDADDPQDTEEFIYPGPETVITPHDDPTDYQHGGTVEDEPLQPIFDDPDEPRNPLDGVDVPGILRVLKAAGIRASKDDLADQVDRHGIGALERYLSKPGVYRHVVTLALRDPSQREAQLERYMREIEYNPEMRQWFMRSLSKDHNFGRMAEKSESDEDRRLMVRQSLLGHGGDDWLQSSRAPAGAPGR